MLTAELTEAQRDVVAAILGRARCDYERYPIGWRATSRGVVLRGPWRPTAAWAARVTKRRAHNLALLGELDNL